MDYVIAGAGPAGVMAAETIRKSDGQGAITILCGEKEPPYSRMALPYFLIERIGAEGTHLRKDKKHFDSLGIDVRQGRIARIDAKAHALSLEDGKTLKYGKLLLATGASPITPPIAGMDLPHVHHCWTLDDGRAIAREAKKGSKVVLMGAGFIGCIILESLHLRGVELTVIEMGDRMVPRMMNQKAGNMIKRWCEAKGVMVKTSTRIKAVEKASGKHPLALTLEGAGESRIEADLLIVAAGVKSNTAFLQGSNLACKDGILVNDKMETSQADIYAAGDVAEGRDFSTGEYSVQAIQPTAVEHGRIAGLNMAGRKASFRGSLNMNVLDTMGLISASFGLWMGVKDGDTAERMDEENYKYLCLQFSGDHLVGAQSLGLTEHVGVLRGLIQSQTNLGAWKQVLMKDPSRIMEAYLGATHNAA